MDFNLIKNVYAEAAVGEGEGGGGGQQSAPKGLLDYIPKSGDIESEIPNNNQVGTIGDILGIMINALMGIAFAFGFIAIAVGFVRIIVSGGDPKARQHGIDSVKWGGAAILLSLFILVIKSIVINMIGLEGYEQATPNF